MVRQVVLVTGCSQGGIGYEICKAYAAKNMVVFASSRRLETMGGLAELGITTLKLDVTSQQSAEEAVKTVIEKAGRIDVLVNNAGAGLLGPAAELELDAMRNLFELNVWGCIRMVQLVVPHMVRQGGGRIINIGSIAGWIATTWHGVYSSSKAALHLMTDTLRLELGVFGIKVVLVTPGAIRSAFSQNSSTKATTKRPWILYKDYSTDIEAREDNKMTEGPGATPTDEFASKMVEAVMKNNPPPVYRYGSQSFLVLILSLLPKFVSDFMLIRKFGPHKRA